MRLRDKRCVHNKPAHKLIYFYPLLMNQVLFKLLFFTHNHSPSNAILPSSPAILFQLPEKNGFFSFLRCQQPSSEPPQAICIWKWAKQVTLLKLKGPQECRALGLVLGACSPRFAPHAPLVQATLLELGLCQIFDLSPISIHLITF